MEAVMLPKVVYNRHYNIGVFGLERLHPFDSRKYGRAWKELRRKFGRELNQFWINPPRPVSESELIRIHTEGYLARLKDRKFIAGVVEIPQLRHLPVWLTDHLVLRPMRWATMGTIVAARAAMDHGLAVNLSGGYHHASPDNGHGFEAEYLDALFRKLPPFLDSVTRTDGVKLAIYNAGTDIYSGDRLGGMNVSAAGILKRDQFVLEELVKRKIPTAVVLSGGYSRESYRMVADMVAFVLTTFGTSEGKNQTRVVPI